MLDNKNTLCYTRDIRILNKIFRVVWSNENPFSITIFLFLLGRRKWEWLVVLWQDGVFLIDTFLTVKCTLHVNFTVHVSKQSRKMSDMHFKLYVPHDCRRQSQVTILNILQLVWSRRLVCHLSLHAHEPLTWRISKN